MSHSRSGFTLVEMLVVVGVVSILLAIGMSAPKADKRRLAVEAAAKGLAATLRQARSMAIERQAQFGVAFNITNGRGTSGRVINNWTGGHWYQILAPRDDNGGGSVAGGLSVLPEAQLTGNSQPLGDFLQRVSKSWYAQRTTLPVHAVRFLALSDEDNGMIRLSNYGSAFPTSYPRPWFGWFDTNTGRLNPWGGYDNRRTGGTPDINIGGRACSGFWYEGLDGAIPGSVSLFDRACSYNGTSGVDHSTDNTKLFTAQEPRPLVNGDWLDACIKFQADGTVYFDLFGRARWRSYAYRGGNAAGGNAIVGYGDLGDLVYPVTSPGGYGHYDNPTVDSASEHASHFQTRTGYWFITLAPDAEEDRDEYPNAAAALRAQSPMFRVGINSFGDVRVIAVRPTLAAGTTLDTTIVVAGGWQNAGVVNSRYRRHVLTDTSGNPRGTAIIDAVTASMLETRGMWAAP